MSLRRLVPSATLALTLLAAGCVAPGMGGVSVSVPVTGGGMVRVEFNSKGIVHASNDDVKIDGVSMLPDPKAKTVRYGATFVALRPLVLRRVTVDDISDDSPSTILVDEHPVLDAHGRWKKLSTPFTPNENNLRFMFELENSIRIYRFTIVTADGRAIVLDDGANYPANSKRFFKFEMGFEKIDQR